jgi:hypothetical protein
MSDSTPLDRDTQKAIRSAKRFNIEYLRKIGSTDWTIIAAGLREKHRAAVLTKAGNVLIDEWAITNPE